MVIFLVRYIWSLYYYYIFPSRIFKSYILFLSQIYRDIFFPERSLLIFNCSSCVKVTNGAKLRKEIDQTYPIVFLWQSWDTYLLNKTFSLFVKGYLVVVNQPFNLQIMGPLELNRTHPLLNQCKRLQMIFKCFKFNSIWAQRLSQTTFLTFPFFDLDMKKICLTCTEENYNYLKKNSI